MNEVAMDMEERHEVPEGVVLRQDALYVSGLYGAEEREIYQYFPDCRPISVDWVDDNACKIVFSSDFEAKQALFSVGKQETPFVSWERAWFRCRPLRPNGGAVSARMASVEDGRRPGGILSRLRVVSHTLLQPPRPSDLDGDNYEAYVDLDASVEGVGPLGPPQTWVPRPLDGTEGALPMAAPTGGGGAVVGVGNGGVIDGVARDEGEVEDLRDTLRRKRGVVEMEEGEETEREGGVWARLEGQGTFLCSGVSGKRKERSTELNVPLGFEGRLGVPKEETEQDAEELNVPLGFEGRLGMPKEEIERDAEENEQEEEEAPTELEQEQPTKRIKGRGRNYGRGGSVQNRLRSRVVVVKHDRDDEVEEESALGDGAWGWNEEEEGGEERNGRSRVAEAGRKISSSLADRLGDRKKEAKWGGAGATEPESLEMDGVVPETKRVKRGRGEAKYRPSFF